MKFATGVLVILAVGGSIGINYLKTPRGAVFLADRDVVLAYERAQLEAGATLKTVLQAQNLRGKIKVIRDEKHADTEAPVSWEIACAETTDLLAVNVALTDAIQRKGLVVRRSEEFDHGRRLVIDVGTNKYDTHRLTLRLVGVKGRQSAHPIL